MRSFFFLSIVLSCSVASGQIKIVDDQGTNTEFQHKSHMSAYAEVLDEAGGFPTVWNEGEDDTGVVSEPVLGDNPFGLTSGSQTISGAGANSFFNTSLAVTELGTTRPGDTTDDYVLTDTYGWAYGPKYNSQPDLSTTWTMGAGVTFDQIVEIKSGNTTVRALSVPFGVQGLSAHVTCWDNNQDYTIFHGKMYLFLNLPDGDGWDSFNGDGYIFDAHFPKDENVVTAEYKSQFDEIRTTETYYKFNHADHENIPTTQTEDTETLDSSDPNTWSTTIDVVFKLEPGETKEIWIYAGEEKDAVSRMKPDLMLQHPQEAGTDEKEQEIAISGYLQHVAYWDITE